MRYLSIAALAFWLISGAAFAQDDTHACLNTHNGPVTEITGDQGYGNFDYFGSLDGARFDARTAVFPQRVLGPDYQVLPDANVYPIDIRPAAGASVCWAGGIVDNESPLDATWNESKQQQYSGVIIRGGKRATVDGMRIHNNHDALEIWLSPNSEFEFRNNWISYTRDDCVENDWSSSGLVEDNLFDGCYVFHSARVNGEVAEGPGNTVVFRNNLIRLQKMPGPVGATNRVQLGQTVRDVMDHGDLFKYHAWSPRHVLENNIILIEGLAATRWGEANMLYHAPNTLGFKQSDGKLAGCSGNIIIWLGEGPFPGDVPDDPACVTVTTDISIWNDARDAWIAAHPQVQRIAGLDPEPQPDPGPEPEPEPLPDLVLAVLELSEITTASALVTFSFGEPTTGETRWGLSAGNLDNVHGPETDLFDMHGQRIGGLPADTKIFYQVQGCNAGGRCGTSDVRSFQTAAEPAPEPDPTPVPDPTPEPEPPYYIIEAVDQDGNPVNLRIGPQ